MKIHNKAADLIEYIKNGDRIFVQGASATPTELINAFVSRLDDLKDIEILHLHTSGKAAYTDPKYKDNLKITNLFVGANMRRSMDYDHIDYLPCFLSEIPNLLKNERKVNVAFIHVSTPDRHGYVSLGTSVDVTLAAIEAADLVLAQINKKMPRVHGDGIVHLSKIDHAIEVDEALEEFAPCELTDEDLRIGHFCAELIEDGSTLQTGIGSIPNAVLAALSGHKHLGVHSEMWSDGVLDLIEKGVIDNSLKNVYRGKTVSSFIMGSSRVYKFIDDNPSVIQVGADYINNPSIIKRNPKVAAINSAVSVDLTGQVCADSVGHRIISGVGGQVDFIRGATLSPGGKPIIALNSRTKSGESKIVSSLLPGSGIVTTRSHIHYIVTEFGIANLYGKTIGERAKALINIAHPGDRERLSKEFVETHRLI